jgi:hypothetical protein
MATTNLRVTELDFDSIKTNLKDYLSSQSDFQDYAFEGSALNILLDVLSYNTHYMSYYVNMVANEMFLDSASNRSSIASIAKHLGYVPTSAKSATATVTLNLTASNAPSVNTVFTLPVGSKFTATGSDTTSYNFSTMNAYSTVPSVADQVLFPITGVVLNEGKRTTRNYVVDTNNLGQRFELQPNVDISTLTVKVQNSSTDSATETYTQFDEISTLTSTSKIYFLEEVESGKYLITFGDGVFGKKLSTGNIIQLTYIIGTGIGANSIGTTDVSGSRSFELSTSVTGISSTEVIVTSTTTGGADSETNESIKFFAPKSFQTQKRTVTANDYKTFIQNKFPNAAAVSTWGGESNDPPEYGKVFIAIKPQTGYTLTDADKTEITDEILAPNKILCITPTIVDPDYTFVGISSAVKYNDTTALSPEGTIQAGVVDAVKSYASTNLDGFGDIFRHSKLTAEIDDSDTSIRSNYTVAKLIKRLTPNTNSTLTDAWTIKLNSPVESGTLVSDTFIQTDSTTTVSFKDSSGVLRLVNSANTVITDNVGTVDYLLGTIVINPINISTITSGNTYIKLTITTDNIDITPLTGQILTIDNSDISVVMEKDSTT